MKRVSLPPDVKKAYGLVMGVGAKLGERARAEDDLLPAVGAAPDAESFRSLVRAKSEGFAPPALVESFLALVRDDDWQAWRSRLLLQAKLSKEGGKPAPGHEQGRGVGRP